MTLTSHLDQLRDTGITEIPSASFHEFAALCNESGIDFFPVHHGGNGKTTIHSVSAQRINASRIRDLKAGGEVSMPSAQLDGFLAAIKQHPEIRFHIQNEDGTALITLSTQKTGGDILRDIAEDWSTIFNPQDLTGVGG